MPSPMTLCVAVSAAVAVLAGSALAAVGHANPAEPGAVVHGASPHPAPVSPTGDPAGAPRTVRSGSTAAGPAAAPVAAPTAARAAARWTPRAAAYEVAVQRDVPITMSDRTVLYADVYRPARGGAAVPGRFPVVLTQTPYNKSGPIGTGNQYLVSRGYVHVVADVRGTGSSHGQWSAFGPREQRDGAELVRWVATRPWSSGRVGTFGPSYMAINQIFTAAQRPAGLKAAFTIVPAGDVYRDVVGSGGQLDVGFIPLWFSLVTGAGLVPPAYTAVDPASGASALAQHLTGAQFQTRLALEVMTGGERAFDGPFYRARSPLTVIDEVRVPTFVVGGWFDLFQRGEPMVYQRLRANGVPTKLLMGPWTHIAGSQGAGLGAPGGPPSYDELALRWFDRYVRGLRDDRLDTDIAPVTYYELGSDTWRTAPRWLDPSVRAKALHLGGTARPGAPGTLTAARSTGAGADRIVPLPVTGLCTRSASQWTAGNPAIDATCGADQRVDSALGTSYELPVSSPLRLFGPVAARLFVSTTARDGMIAARLEDVAPDGSVKQLTAGWQVLSLRKLDRARSVVRDGRVLQPWHPFTRASVLPVHPDEVMETYVEIFPTGAVVRPGHRLRVTFQAFDTPHLAPPLPQAANSLGMLTIHHGARYPSQVLLPVR